jgi:NFU1 iron-sulfur cluster scaffold homolog, mitochondrial
MKPAADKRHVTLYLESNPNPNSLKFVFNFMLLPEGMHLDFADRDQAAASPLATELFEFPYIRRVFFMNNFITITKSDEVLWEEVTPEVKNFLREYFENGKPLMIENFEESSEINENDPPVIKEIKTLLDEYIRPAVEQDGGAIRFHSYVDGVVKVQLQGSCSGCPSSTLTLKAGIERLLKMKLPEIKEVVAEGV